ncbi:MAG: ABC transporter permease [Alphaproteobacteria bacterium]|nr:ABC transporter permease [Alphaproteobacteria bacterium]
MPQPPLRPAATRRRQGLLLTLPLLAFIAVFFAAPIGTMLWRSVANPLPAALLPRTTAALAEWDPAALPAEGTFAALVEDLKALPERQDAARLGAQLNFDLGGLNSAIRKTAREAQKLQPPYAESLPKLDAAWGRTATWAAIRVGTQALTGKNYLAALDLRTGADLRIVPAPENERIYLMLFARTAWVAGLVTALCLVLGYPLAHVLATASPRVAGVLMILLLLPFWTSLLVRTTAWIVLLQSQGVVNDLLVWLGLIDDTARVQLVYNMTGTLIAMTQILLPFMVLPLYSVMKTIPPTYLRAASSMGARPLQGFRRVYLPMTMPGVAAGGLLVFILAVGYYITPALVGGASGQLISNWIAYHMQQSLNWGLAAALGALLLFAVVLLYLVFNRIAGADRLRFG